MAEITRREFEEWMERLSGQLAGVNTRLDKLNGQTHENATEIAILKDRSDTLKETTVADGKAAAIWGGGIGGILIAVAEIARWYLAK